MYRDQHFFLERNFIHEILLRNTEIALMFFMIIKIMIILLAATFQLFYVKRLFDTNYQTVPGEESN